MKLLHFEDVIKVYVMDALQQLFPKYTKNKIIVYIIGFFHLLGTFILQYGVWILPQKYLYLYLIFALTNMCSYYFIFKKQCFMTLLTNYYANTKGTALKIRMTTAIIGLSFNIIICIIGIIFPSYAPSNFIKKIVCGK